MSRKRDTLHLAISTAADLGWRLDVLQDLGDRSEQEDAWAVADVGGRLLVVIADGMGGHRGGREAALKAVDTFVDVAIARGFEVGEELLHAALYAADAALPTGYRAPGTTLTAALLDEHGATFAHVGDSILWAEQGGTWYKRTERHGIGNILELSLGGAGLRGDDVPPHFGTAEGDAFLLATDGLSPDEGGGLWGGSDGRRSMAPADLGDDTLPLTLAAARKAGSTDNATGILLRRAEVSNA